MRLSDIMHIIRDSLTIYKREMLIFKSKLRTNIIRSIIFPLVLIIMLGNLGNTSNITTNVAVVNYALNAKAYSFIQSLESNHNLKIVNITTETEAMNELRLGKVTDVIIVPESFAQLGDKPNLYIYYSSGSSDLGDSLQIIDSVAREFGVNSNVTPVSDIRSVSNPSYGASASYKTFLVGGIIVMVAVFGSIFGGGMSIITDRQLGNLKSFLITPISKMSIIIGKILSGTTQATIYGIIAIIIGVLDGATILMGFYGIIIILALIILVSLGFSALTIILASRISKVEVYSILANAITLPLWFISGAFFPTSSLPSWLQPVSAVDPLTYAANGIRYIMMDGYYPMSTMVLDFSVLIVFSLVLIYLSFKMFSVTIR